MRPTIPEQAADRPRSIIDVLQAGFTLLNRNVWLLVIPVAIDLVLWLGPSMSIGSLTERWLVAATVPPGVDAGLTQSFEDSRQVWLTEVRKGEGVARANLLSLLVLPTVLLSLALPIHSLPSFRGSLPPEGPTLAVGMVSQAAMIALACVFLGLALGAVFFGLLGQAVRTGKAVPNTFAADFGRIFLWVLALAGLVIVLLFGAGIPLVLATDVIDSRAPQLTFALAPFALGILLWLYFYLFFTTDALFVSIVSPLVAIQHSIAVVRYNFWSSLGLIALVMIISAGFPHLWAEIARGLGRPGVALAILGHSYISAGLAAASMTYYKERLDRLRSS